MDEEKEEEVEVEEERNDCSLLQHCLIRAEYGLFQEMRRQFLIRVTKKKW